MDFVLHAPKSKLYVTHTCKKPCMFIGRYFIAYISGSQTGIFLERPALKNLGM